MGLFPLVLRIIPANTGKISPVFRAIADTGDHPREYGENVLQSIATAEKEGSSPRIRGKFEEVNAAEGIVGIIPANTGKIALSPPSTTVA